MAEKGMKLLTRILLIIFSFIPMFTFPDVRCIAKVKITNLKSHQIREEKPKYNLKFDYEILEVSKGFWQNSCELDVPAELKYGIVEASEAELNLFENNSHLFLMGMFNNGRFKLKYQLNEPNIARSEINK